MEEDYLMCDNCGTYWSPDKNDYSYLKDDDVIPCSCGHIMCKKGELE